MQETNASLRTSADPSRAYSRRDCGGGSTVLRLGRPLSDELLRKATGRARVTVISRTRDRPLMLRRCIESVLGQTFADILHLIVNDGGNPGVVDLLVAEYADRYAGRVQVIHHATSLGMQNASNSGVAAAGTEYLAIHDDDDSWQPDFLRECVGYLDERGPESTCQGVATQTVRIWEEIDSEGAIHEIRREDYYPIEQISLFATAANNPFAPIALVYRRSVHEVTGLFNEAFSVLGDWDFNLRFLKHYDIGVIDKRLANYHWRDRLGGSAYANTVTDALDVHRQKAVEIRNHYLRNDLADGRLGLGYIINSAHFLHGHSALLWEAIHRGDAAIHRIEKVHTRLRRWEWFFTRNTSLKRTLNPSAPAPALRSRKSKTRAPGCREELENLLRTGRFFSFDVFDTALLRAVQCPADVFLYMEDEVRRVLRDHHQKEGASLPIQATRLSAEKIARRRRFDASRHEEISLDDIYGVFCELAGIDPACKSALMEVELEAESRLCYGNPIVREACATALRAEATVIFISDMYLPREFILRLLAREGYPANVPLFLSSEYGKNKHTGDLFEEVLATLSCAPADIVHIGDNAHSDVAQPRAKGWRAIHWRAADLKEGVPLVDQLPEERAAFRFAERDLISSLCTGIVRKRGLFSTAPSRPVSDNARNGQATGKGGDLWDKIGYEVGGPLYFCLVQWLIKHVREEGIERLFFLARDGYHLHGAFSLAAESAGLSVETCYMAASRRLLNFPQIHSLDHAALQFLGTPNPSLTVRHFFSRLGISAELFREEAARVGFASLDDVITTPGGVFVREADHQAMMILFRAAEQHILGQAAEERARLLAYFRQIGFAPGKMAVVDLGWQGSSAKALQCLLNLGGCGPGANGVNGTPGRYRLRAFYFGTWHFARAAVDAGCDLSSYFFHLDKPFARRDLAAASIELIELFFGAPHPTIIGLQDLGRGLEPVYGDREHSDEERGHLTRMRERAVDFVRDATNLSSSRAGHGLTGDGLSYLDAVLDRFLRRPSLEEARLFGAICTRDSFGSASPLRALAKPPTWWERWRRPASLRDAYARCFWKKGFLAQLNPADAADLQS